ncbi:MAG TPA: hypothetical protein VNH21_11425, partial [Steroidobacteraceae bacterium]|nr:hypothetical protein [Steroidobacteraceae bacterium]
MLTEQDIYLFREGTHSQLHSRLGCRMLPSGVGAHFAVWAPNAAAVSVIGDWNGWQSGTDALTARGDS